MSHSTLHAEGRQQFGEGRPTGQCHELVASGAKFRHDTEEERDARSALTTGELGGLLRSSRVWWRASPWAAWVTSAGGVLRRAAARWVTLPRCSTRAQALQPPRAETSARNQAGLQGALRPTQVREHGYAARIKWYLKCDLIYCKGARRPREVRARLYHLHARLVRLRRPLPERPLLAAVPVGLLRGPHPRLQLLRPLLPVDISPTTPRRSTSGSRRSACRS